MKIVNLTPYAITFVSADGTPILTVEPSGQVARVASKITTIGDVDVSSIPDDLLLKEAKKELFLLPVTTTVFGKVEGLPDPTDNTIFIVSSLVAQRVPDREDVFIPNESVRDDKGRIIGCKSLGRV